MGLFSPITDALGLTNDPGEAAGMAQYNPYNINASYGNVDYDPASRTFTSQLDPRMQQMQQSLFGEFGNYNADNYLSLLRQRAAPQNEANYQGLENRLFSQGRLDHSQAYQPGGAMRGLFDAQAQQDLGFQIGADEWAMNQRSNLMDQMGWFNQLESGLWNPLAQQGQIGAAGQRTAAGIYGNQQQFNSAMTHDIYKQIAGGIMGGIGLGG